MEHDRPTGARQTSGRGDADRERRADAGILAIYRQSEACRTLFLKREWVI